MKIGRLAFFGYLIFLLGYTYWKYAAAAPAEFSMAYAQSVGILVLMTGVAPFFITLALIKGLGLKGLTSSIAGLVFGLAFCVAGYAGFWTLFINPTGAEVPLLAVAMRGVGWGLLQGGLASIAANH